jgi:hypothetical protein
MRQRPPNVPRDVAREEAHTELLGRNAFVIAMMGAVGFVTACFMVTMQ